MGIFCTADGWETTDGVCS